MDTALAPGLLGPSQACCAEVVLVLGRETLAQLIFHHSKCKVQERWDGGGERALSSWE
jgi:hypothetical protein